MKSKERISNTANGKKSTMNSKAPFAETAILTMSDLERIKKNATILTKEDEMNNKKILEDQKQFAQASAQVSKNLIIFIYFYSKI